MSIIREILPMLSSHFNSSWIHSLLNTGNKEIEGNYNGINYKANIVIPNYKYIVADHYNDIVKHDIDGFCNVSEIAPIYEHYGTHIEFEHPVQIDIHDSEQVLEIGLKQLMKSAGPVIFRNAYLSPQHREVQQRNSFPHLNFHIDRNINMPTRYSVYTRDPFDEEQRYPRKSSTLFIASIVGYLQGIREGLIDPNITKGINRSFEVFRKTDLSEYIGKLMIEQRWDAPENTGELSMLDNATELHSSYERQLSLKGYRIGVRYLA